MFDAFTGGAQFDAYIETVVYCESKYKFVEQKNCVKIVHWKSIRNRFLNKPLLGLKSTLHALIFERDSVVFHYNTWAPALWSFLPLLFGKKVVLHEHGFEWRHSKYTSFQKRILIFLEKITLVMNRNVITVSQEQADFFLKKYSKFCYFLPCAINFPNLNVSDKNLKKFKLVANSYLLFLGRLTKVKNPLMLIQAYLKANPSIKLVLAGDYEKQDITYFNQLRKYSEIDDRIVFTGPIYGEDKESILKNCLAMVLPSTSEGMSITVLEAMSYRRICIVSDIPANRYLLGNNAYYVKVSDIDSLADKIKKVCTQKFDNLSGVEENYHNVVNMYTWDKITNNYLNYISHL